MNFQTAQRCLELAAGVAAESESCSLERNKHSGLDEQSDVPMTQVPDDSGSNVLLSTQIQGRLDELELKDGMRRDLSQFALDTPLPAAIEKKSTRRAKVKPGTPKPRSNKRRKRSSTTVKSITQYNMEKFESIKGQQRRRHVMSLLSGKKGKIKDILDCLEADQPSLIPPKKKCSFSTYSAEEWSHILQLLSSRFPRCPPSQVDRVFDYLYGEEDEAHVWYASQIPPAGAEDQVEGSRGSCFQAVPPVALTLSQAIEDDGNHNVGKSNEIGGCSGSQSDTQEAWSCIPNTTDESSSEIHIDESFARDFKDQMLRSAAVSPSKLNALPDTFEAPKALSHKVPSLEFLHTKQPLRSSKLERQNTVGSAFSCKPVVTSPLKLAGRDQLIDLTQNSFNVVTSLMSVVKTDIQVPLTRTATWNDKPVTINSGATRTKPNGLNTKLKFRLYRNVDRAAVYASASESCAHLQWEALGSLYNDSEGDGDEEDVYELLQVTFGPHNDSTSPAAKVVSARNSQENTVFSEEMQPSETQVEKSPSLPPSLSFCFAKDLRHNLKAIGLKPKRTRSEMLHQMESASQHLLEGTHEHQRQQIFDQLTAIVEHDPPLLEKVYTFEPLVFTELLQYLIKQHPLVSDLDEKTVRTWADTMGICLRSAAED
ncbi:LAME_0F15588g1_1 [Lachancea meyersii CBS 8951]|uniref:Structure-specific endonuclease subunit SLX4 n=1 Tax=Lachancea meyersii CBS 8951 TaxID=1266667 RepID=A0A1G4JYJ2_9SACH|nr:LAME_0F15588g1_1 [Lachancea meyersii CBS 8951]